MLADEGVEHSLLAFGPTGLHLGVNFLANGFELSLYIELLDKFREILDVVLVVHFRILFENDELVDGGVALLAPFFFKLSKELLSPVNLLRQLAQSPVSFL